MRVPVTEKYERFGWPSVECPDLTLPEGWSLPLIHSPNRVYQHRLSPDGERIAFIWNLEEQADVYVMPSKGGWPSRISFTRDSTTYWWGRAPQWSPVGKWLAFRMKEHVHIAESRGSIPSRLPLPLEASASPAWLPDSNQLVITIRPEEIPHLALTDRAGTFLRTLTRDHGEDSDPRPSPDGKWVAYVHWPDDDLMNTDPALRASGDGLRANDGFRLRFGSSPSAAPGGLCGALDGVKALFEI
ncbi:MAG: hypothetical protein ABIG63_22020 [Chloroflexota bacterium]